MLRLFELLLVLSGIIATVKSNEGCKNVEIVKRDEWNAKPPLRTQSLSLPVNIVVIQHTVTKRCRNKLVCIKRMQDIQDMHMDSRGWWDLAYNFVVGGDGRVYEGRGWSTRGAHSVNFNSKSLGIAFMGNFNKYEPNEAMLNATLNFIQCGVEKGYLAPTREIYGHRDVSCTDSPGNKLYAIIRMWDGYKGGRLPEFHCDPLGIPNLFEEDLDY